MKEEIIDGMERTGTMVGGDAIGRRSHQIVANDTGYFRLPIYSHFGVGPLHIARARGEWDMDGLAGEYPVHLVRSRVDVERRAATATKRRFLGLLFRPREDLFVFCNGQDLVIYGSDRGAVEGELDRLRRRHDGLATCDGHFKVLKNYGEAIDGKAVVVPRAARMSGPELALHYGEDFPDWEGWFVDGLGRTRNTISILQGEPGTGKTSFLRHLIVTLCGTHRFYFIPPSDVGSLIQSGAMNFWSDETKLASDQPPVLIIEDAERSLMRRGSDNHEDVSNILTLADGLWGHCVRAHIICTINGGESDIDPALVRPGRLLAWRSFRRLTREEAERLAKSKGLAMPEGESCTLAELYHGNEQTVPRGGRSVGFGGALPGGNGSRP
jgi:hypothetical protein